MIKIEEKIIVYFKPKKDVVAVFLFGSHAVGMEKSFSDVDVGVVFTTEKKVASDLAYNLYLPELSRLLRKDLHLVVLNTASEALLEQVYKKGKCLLVNNQKQMAWFQMNAVSKILDFSFTRRKIQSGFVKNLLKE